MKNWAKYLNYYILTDITASASLYVAGMFDVFTTITVSTSLISDVVFRVAVSLPLFLFFLSRVLLRFLSFTLSIISFDGFSRVISLEYFGMSPHFLHSSTAFIGFRGVFCNTSKYFYIILIAFTLSAGFNFFAFLFLDVGSRLSLRTVDSLPYFFINIFWCEPWFNPDIQNTCLVLKFPFSGTL